MNRKHLLLAIATASTPFLSMANFLSGISIVSPRSQSTNSAQELAGWHNLIHQYDRDTTYGVLAATTGYMRSIRPERIADILFGTNCLRISGSEIINRAPHEILADYFGLSPAFISDVHIHPLIQNAYISLDGYIGFDSWVHGLYLKIHAPIVWTHWDLGMKEEVFDSGSTTPFPAKYMSINPLIAPATSWIESLNGTTRFGDMQNPLKYCKNHPCNNAKATVSDVQIALGWDFVLNEYGHVGLNIRTSIPTGTRPNGIYMFEPIIGNGKHWELGLGFTGRRLVWEKDGTQKLNVFADVNAMHLFKARQRRCFDFSEMGRCELQPRYLSRFILLKEFDEDKNYIRSLSPAANHTTLCCDVSVALQLDATLMLGYTYNNFVCDLGYNLWFRSKEKIDLRETLPNNKFGLKGIQNVVDSANQPSAITQSTATIFGNNISDQIIVADPISPRFVNTQDLSLSSGASPRVLTHKIFGYLGGTFYDHYDHAIPFVGIGSDIEFEGINESYSHLVYRNTVSAWSVWLKFGAEFN